MILAATGHRPDKLGGYGEDILRRLVALAEAYLIGAAPAGTISGMALGWDTAWAIASARLGIPFTAAVPFEGQERMWPETSRIRYRRLLNKAADVKIICPGEYSARSMELRNYWMVDNSDRLVALWDGSKGGTGNCVKYARKVKADIHNLWDCWFPHWTDPLISGVSTL